MIDTINMQCQNHIPCRRPRRRHRRHRQPTSNNGWCLGTDFGPRESEIPFERKHVVIVMDATEEFSVETLEWVLKNIGLGSCCMITLLGVKPWLTFAYSCKTDTDIWTLNNEDLMSMKDTEEWKNDVRSQKAQRLVDLCMKYGVTPRIEIRQGSPKRSLVLETITSAYATWVVFDRHHKKKQIEYIAKKVPCNILLMSNKGEVDMIRGRSKTIESNDEMLAFTPSKIPAPTLMLSKEYKKFLNITSP